MLLFVVVFFAWRTLPAYLDHSLPGVQSDFSPSITALGLLQSPVYNLTFQNTNDNAVISDIDVHVGQFVHRGQVLARLNTNALRAALAGEQLAVATGRNYVSADLRDLRRATRAYIALVASAQHGLWVAQRTLSALYRQDLVAIIAAQVTLADDVRALATARIQASAQEQAAQAQFVQSKQDCETSSSSSSSKGALKSCLADAEAQLQEAVAGVRSTLAGALATVVEDRALVVLAIASARADIIGAQADVVEARDNVPVALFDTGWFGTARDVSDSQGDLAGSVAELWDAQAALLDSVLIAPHDGVVTAINGSVGSLPGTVVDSAAWEGNATTGDNVFIQLVDLVGVDHVLLNVDEKDIINVRVGQRVQFTLTVYGKRQFSGSISAISPNGVYTDNKMGFPVVVNIDAGSTQGVKLYPNMMTHATLSF